MRSAGVGCLLSLLDAGCSLRPPVESRPAIPELLAAMTMVSHEHEAVVTSIADRLPTGSAPTLGGRTAQSSYVTE